MKNPSKIKHSAPFWSLNGDLKAAELRWQMRYLKKMGFGGVFMHSRTGLVTKYLSARWFKLINACIDEGKKIGFKTWFYDEDRWPSGYAGGRISKQKKYRAQWIYMDEKKPGLPAAPGKKLGDFKVNGSEVTFTLGDASVCSWFNGNSYVNTFKRSTAEAFVASTHERYLRHCGTDNVPGIFTDEPQYGFFAFAAEWQGSPWITVPYDPQLRKLIKKHYRYDIFDRLPELFSREAGGGFNAVRYHYIKTITDLFRKEYIAYISEWCRKNDLVYTGHMMGEDTLLSQTWNCGDAMSFYPFFGMPGIDQLAAYSFDHLPPRQLGSAARQYGQRDRLAELYGATGWEYPPEGHQLIGDLLLAHGINFRCQHLSDYTISGEAKRDYPGSISFQMPWSSDYHLIEERFDRLTERLYHCDRNADVLVISPVESVWGMAFSNFRDDEDVKAFNYRYEKFLRDLQCRNIDHDLGSEILLAEDGRVAGGKLYLGKCGYKAVILPEMKTIRSTTLALLKKFQAAGGTVFFSSAPPEMIDAKAYEGEFPLAADSWEKITALKKYRVGDDRGIINAALYCSKECEQLLLTNTAALPRLDSAPWSLPLIHERNIEFEDLTIRWKSNITAPVCEYDPEKDRFFPVNARREGEEWIITTSFKRLQTKLFVLSKKALPVEFVPEAQYQEVTLPGEFEYSLSEKNILLFDHFSCEELDRTSEYVLKLDDMVRTRSDIPLRQGHMIQPWAAPKLPPVKPMPLTLSTRFGSELQGIAVELVLENPELNKASLNGFPGTICKGKWFVDKSFKIVSFPAEALKKGTNLLEIKTLYNEKHPGLEAVFLRGNFAVDRHGTRITALPEKLHSGNMVDQGLPFYCGGVKCKFKVTAGEVPLKLRLPRFSGALVKVKAAGKKAGVIWHPPYELDISKYISANKTSTIELELVNSPRNMLGPFYVKDKYFSSAPFYFSTLETEERNLVPLGFECSPQ